tara:strand:+ start:864 stop:1037 length:174 start_codon:yes stop_codon:yes gene_type:complete
LDELERPPLIWTTAGKLHLLVKDELIIVERTAEQLTRMATEILKTVNEMNAQKKRGP